MKERITTYSSNDLAALDSYRGHGYLHLHAENGHAQKELRHEIFQVHLGDGSRLVPYDIVGSGLVAELPLYSFIGVVEIPSINHQLWQRKLVEKQGEQLLQQVYSRSYRAQEQVLFLVDRRGDKTLARSWRKNSVLSPDALWGEIQLQGKRIFEPILLMKAIDFLQREEANPEPLQVLTAAFQRETTIDEGKKGTLSEAGCVIHDDTTKTLNTNLLIRSLASEEMKVITTGSKVDHLYIHVHSGSSSTLTPETLATPRLLGMVNDKELIALSLANVSNMIGARNPTNLGNPVTNGKIYEGLLKSIPKVLEIAGNGGSISQAKEIVKDATGFRK